MLLNNIDIFENYTEKERALAKSLTKLRMNQNGNKLAGRKYRDKIPQLEPKLAITQADLWSAKFPVCRLGTALEMLMIN
jgi:hypothetical protein